MSPHIVLNRGSHAEKCQSSVLLKLKFLILNGLQTSQVELGLPVVSHGLLYILLPVLLGDWDQDHAHHKDHQPDGQQGRSQDVCHLPAVAGEPEAADDDAACQEAAPGGH